jgi:hypothetical protein
MYILKHLYRTHLALRALNRRDMLPQKDQSRPEHGRHEHTCTRDVHLFENKR